METMHGLYNARKKRVEDAVKLIEPDRIPLVPVFQAFPVYYANKWTIQDIMEDYTKATDVYDYLYDHFQSDLGWDPILFYPINYMERSGINWFRWPGNQINDPNTMYQFIEGEYMKGDEYLSLIHI